MVLLQGNAMSFRYYDIPIFALNNEKEVDALIEVIVKKLLFDLIGYFLMLHL